MAAKCPSCVTLRLLYFLSTYEEQETYHKYDLLSLSRSLIYFSVVFGLYKCN